MSITERVILSAKDNVDEWKDALKVMLQTLKAQDGHLRTREDQQKLELLIGWESIEAPIKFQASPAFQDMLYQITPVLAVASKIIVIKFKPYAPKEVIDAHLVQMLTIEQGAAFEDDIRDEVTKFKNLEGCTGVASGISSDDVDGKGKVFVAAVGWDSLEASEKAKVTMTGGAERHHVNFGFHIKELHGL